MTDEALAQCEMDQIMEARYERARHMLRGAYSDQVVFNDVVYPTWIDDSESFWYIRVVKEAVGVSHEVRIVDANEKKNRLAFENAKLSIALEKSTGEKMEAKDLKFLQSYPGCNILAMEISLKLGVVRFNFSGKSWLYDLFTEQIKQTDTIYVLDYLSPEKTSPDGKKVIFIKDHNIWIRDINSGKETAQTSDGMEYNAYQIDFMGVKLFTCHWSPDGMKFLAIQHDTRQTEEAFKLAHKEDTLRPSVVKLKGFAMKGDQYNGSFRYVAIDLDTGKVQKPDRPKISNEYMLSFTNSNFSWWGKDSKLAYFVDADRYHKAVQLVEFDTQTGKTRVLFEETSDTHFMFGPCCGEDQPMMIPLPETEELLWFSERSGWGHLYLYDLKNGEVKNAVTAGEWLVRSVVRYDAKRREVFLQTAGRDTCKDPYYRDLVRVNIDTGQVVPLADSNHDIEAYSAQSARTNEWGGYNLNGVAPNGNYAVVTQSRVDTEPVTYLLDRQGRAIMTVEEADVSRLPEGFQWPEPVKTLAADGKTDIYGVLYRPSDFSAGRKYPVVNHVLNAPGVTFASKSAFNIHQFTTFSSAAIAELGFIVMQFDGRGTPNRSKAFQDESYGDFCKASNLSDHVVSIQQLGERYPYLDLSRVGIASEMFDYGSGASYGLLKYPDFYKVGVEGVVADIRVLPAYVSDHFTGAVDTNINLEEFACNLQGKLLLPVPGISGDYYGLLVETVFKLAGAFAKANKDVDLSYDPSPTWGLTTYQIRRGWDYLVRHLQDNVPPENFILNGTAMWDAGALEKTREELGVGNI